VDDLADACCFIMNRDFSDFDYKNKPLFNIGTGKDITIKNLAELIKKITGYTGNIVFDPSKPDGTPQKLLDVSRISDMGWQARTSLEDGIAEVFLEFGKK
jgi:GDP-L-fucose synthase